MLHSSEDDKDPLADVVDDWEGVAVDSSSSSEDKVDVQEICWPPMCMLGGNGSGCCCAMVVSSATAFAQAAARAMETCRSGFRGDKALPLLLLLFALCKMIALATRGRGIRKGEALKLSLLTRGLGDSTPGAVASDT